MTIEAANDPEIAHCDADDTARIEGGARARISGHWSPMGEAKGASEASAIETVTAVARRAPLASQRAADRGRRLSK